ncbi:hypothetical protein PVAP13_5KG435707 [Panicum virgatum]|uniref:Uncharacterized protein n=1 Tax=Panicum virgatum TaxID=38727 RepID=A0A8T0SNJ8_PANVG|nr:hypothetical protein PVAP13_5KG435707 [Panicum virgatum]
MPLLLTLPNRSVKAYGEKTKIPLRHLIPRCQQLRTQGEARAAARGGASPSADPPRRELPVARGGPCSRAWRGACTRGAHASSARERCPRVLGSRRLWRSCPAPATAPPLHPASAPPPPRLAARSSPACARPAPAAAGLSRTAPARTGGGRPLLCSLRGQAGGVHASARGRRQRARAGAASARGRRRRARAAGGARRRASAGAQRVRAALGRRPSPLPEHRAALLAPSPARGPACLASHGQRSGLRGGLPRLRGAARPARRVRRGGGRPAAEGGRRVAAAAR